MHFNVGSTDIPKVSFCIVLKIVRYRDPNGSFPSTEEVLKYDTSYCTTFADTGTITYKKLKIIKIRLEGPCKMHPKF